MRTQLASSALVCSLLVAGLALPGYVGAQQVGSPKQESRKDAQSVKGPGGADPETIESINRDFETELKRLERQRLERLARLAIGQEREAANRTYDAYFQLAIASRLYREAEPTAERVLRLANPSSQIAALAAIINIVAEADRGAYEESLASLISAFQLEVRDAAAAAAGPSGPLPRATRLLLAEAYYQRLIQADQFDIARQAMRLIQDKTDDAAIKDFASIHLRLLDLIGKPAPSISGTDIEGKEVRLADFQGDVVLVVFWATWYVPASEDIAWLDSVYETYRGRGFRVLGVNLDTSQDGGEKLETVMPNIRRFLLNHNVRWPNVINGPGDHDYAKAYGITALPANVLIGRDGTVIHLDLNRANLERVVAKAIGR
jgi:AhpC/TSA family